MAKISSKNQEQKIPMSEQMIKNCKNKIAKFSFKYPEYEKFLISVKAMKDESIVLIYRNEELQKYRETYIKENEHNIGDTFQFDKFKIMSSDENGNQYENGYFSPKSFWDSIRDKKIN